MACPSTYLYLVCRGRPSLPPSSTQIYNLMSETSIQGIIHGQKMPWVDFLHLKSNPFYLRTPGISGSEAKNNGSSFASLCNIITLKTAPWRPETLLSQDPQCCHNICIYSGKPCVICLIRHSTLKMPVTMFWHSRVLQDLIYHPQIEIYLTSFHRISAYNPISELKTTQHSSGLTSTKSL